MPSKDAVHTPPAITRRLSAGAAGLPAIALFGGTLFLSALLLFSIQPLFAKMVLPRLGGTPAVWSIAMVFFQAMLLAGYGYAHLIVRGFGVMRALAVHAAVMAAAFFWLPIGIAAGFESPPATGLPIWLLWLFAASVGIPFFATASNAPLLQAWFARTGHPHSADPYFLYGASNLGSFFALLSYPVLIEPLLTIGDQSRLWACLYVALTLVVLACGLFARATGGASRIDSGAAADAPDRLVTWRERFGWMILASLPSALLIAVTAHLSTNIAAAPFLWVLPLAAFLLTFVLAFRRSPLIPPRWAELMTPVAAVAAILTYALTAELGGLAGIAINLLAFFIIALAWHSALVARRPAACHLTDFYFCMSAGGVLGGAFVSLAAPLFFDSVIEFPLLLAVSLLIVPEARTLLARRPPVATAALLLLAVLVIDPFANVEYRDRSFFGIVSTRLVGKGDFRVLIHGTTVHGAERVAEVAADRSADRRPEPLTYYAAGGPLATGIAMEQARRAAPLEVGVVGLGVGSLACYRRPGEAWRFYEIDPAVITVASDPRLFTFLSACAPDAAIVRGDARLSLGHEPDGRFDVLVIDAFSSDSIPVHLLTREALRLYADKTRADGVVFLHISNQYMELAGVVAAGAAADGLAAARMLYLRTKSETSEQRLSSDVVVIARDPARIEAYRAAGWSALAGGKGIAPWTDDYSNAVAAVLRKRGLL